MSDNIRDLFIVNDEFHTQSAEEQAKRLLPFGRATKDGGIIIQDRTLSKGDQLKVCLAIRHIASALTDGHLNKEVRAIELVDILHQRTEAIGSALSKLVSESFAKKVGPGKYVIYPHRIDSFLDRLEDHAGGSSEKRTSRKSGKGNALTGIGRHIQQLIDDKFFDTPRLISEAVEELKREGIIRDPKVIDKTIRDSFVSMRRSLQRIPNTEGGLAKWKYVIRK